MRCGVKGLTEQPSKRDWAAIKFRASAGVGWSDKTNGVTEESHDNRAQSNTQTGREGRRKGQLSEI